MRATKWILLTLAALQACGPEPRSGPPEDAKSPSVSATGAGAADAGGFGELVMAPGYELVLQHCVRCHGPRQFLQQRGSRDTWRGLIRWMQRDHGMPAIDEGIEDQIVEYLAVHYAPTESGRRRALTAELMPPNPYAK